MSFLDNLENNLKAMEERDATGLGAAPARREEDRKSDLAAAPFAERLKSGPFTARLFDEAARAGHQVRTLVQPTWLGRVLRLQARDRRLELRPTPEGVLAVFLEDGRELRSTPVDLDGDPAPLVRELLGLA